MQPQESSQQPAGAEKRDTGVAAGAAEDQGLRVPDASSMVIEVEPLEVEVLGSRKKSMLEMLRALPDGAKYVAEAEKLAETVTLDNLKALLEHGQEARDALSAVANQMIGDRKIGAAGPVGKLFSDLADLEKELDVQSVTAPKGFMVQLLTALPFGLGKHFEPVYRFFERFRELRPEIDKKEHEIGKLEVARVESQHQLRALQESSLSGFRGLEVAIAAGEIALERERGAFNRDRETVNRDDVVELQKLKVRRLGITNLDNRLMRLQNARVDAVMDLPIVDLAIDNEEKLRSSLEDLRTITIPQIRKAVAIAIRIHDQREAAALAGGIQQLNEALREANLTMLGMAQQETHKVATRGAREAEHLVNCMEKLGTLLKTGNELLRENAQLNQEAREKLIAAEKKFRQDINESLQDLAAQPA